ncbi:MAG: DUF1963 domain-containing protein [Clostridia bacterium]|nr:DUF1963 domain-containing protein [Clostridia bacterium]
MSIFDKLKELFRKKPAEEIENDCDSDLEGLKEKYIELLRNCIGVKIEGSADEKSLMRFGGMPYAPKDFKWPYFETDSVDDLKGAIKPRPLAFLAQFDCSKLAACDKDNLLPHTGILSFFYSIESDCWGDSPEDADCSRVYWFENVDELIPTPFPADLAENYRFPSLAITLTSANSYPDYESLPEKYDSDEYEEFYEALHAEESENITKLLGWADSIQSGMEPECELIGNGYSLGDGKIPQKVREEAEHKSQEKWQLLLQLDTVESDDFELMFGDGGRLYFWIRKEDLVHRRFDRVWLILQCY